MPLHDTLNCPDPVRHAIWVFVLLAYLLWVGASRLKAGVRDLAKIGSPPASLSVGLDRPVSAAGRLLGGAHTLGVGFGLGA